MPVIKEANQLAFAEVNMAVCFLVLFKINMVIYSLSLGFLFVFLKIYDRWGLFITQWEIKYISSITLSIRYVIHYVTHQIGVKENLDMKVPHHQELLLHAHLSVAL